ncbi:MAG: MlaD family protein [Candidatus Tyrphobacter sp.]
MSRQGLVGAFAIVAVCLFFLVFYELQNLGSRSGYELAIHFNSAAGLQKGYGVFMSGVQVGSVESVVLLPDDTVDVVASINKHIGVPRGSRFIVNTPFTGAASLQIFPPRGGPKPYPTIAPGVPPVAQQPTGTNVATMQQLIAQGQGELHRLDRILALLQEREPALLAQVQSTLAGIDTLSHTLNGSLGSAGRSIAAMAETLNSTATLDAPRVDAMLAQLASASSDLRRSMAAVESVATDPTLRANVIATTQNIAQTTHTLALLTADLRTITSDPATQAQMRDTIANLDATMARAASLLGRLGGKSSVYGVDAGATAPPRPPAPIPGGEPMSRPQRLAIGSALAGVARNLIELQLRVGYLDRESVCCGTPLLGADRGPQTDLNAILLPHGSTSVLFGANDIGHDTTWNLAALRTVAPDLRLGGGFLYSRLGVLGEYGANGTGLEARFYDPRHPTLDLYGDVRLTPWLQLFAGERALNGPQRRTDYGIQFHY